MIKQINKIALSSWKNKLLLVIIFILSCFILYSFVSDIYDTVQVVKLVHSENAPKKSLIKAHPVVSKVQLQPSDIFGENQATTTRVNTSLNLEGVIVASESDKSAAIIAPQNSESKLYSVGQDVLPGLKLEEVYHDYVVLNRNGVREKLFIDWSSRIKASENPEATLNTNITETSVIQTPSDNGNIQNVREIEEKIRSLPQFPGFDFKSIMKQRRRDGGL